MNRTLRLVLGLAAVAALLTVALVSTALAQTRAPRSSPFGLEMVAELEDQDLMGSCHADVDHHAILWQSLAASLTMTTDELKEQMKQGKTLEQIASAKKLGTVQLDAAIKAALEEMMSQHVRDGEWSQAEADKAFEEMIGHLTIADFFDMLVGSMHGGLGGMYPGMMDDMYGSDSGGMMEGGGCHGDSGSSIRSQTL